MPSMHYNFHEKCDRTERIKHSALEIFKRCSRHEEDFLTLLRRCTSEQETVKRFLATVSEYDCIPPLAQTCVTMREPSPESVPNTYARDKSEH